MMSKKNHPFSKAERFGQQEGRAQKALSLLHQQLRMEARVRRDGAWTTLPAGDLTPGDIVHLRQGSIVPADVRIGEGSLLVDHRRVDHRAG